jgi:hypothetical protein
MKATPYDWVYTNPEDLKKFRRQYHHQTSALGRAMDAFSAVLGPRKSREPNRTRPLRWWQSRWWWWNHIPRRQLPVFVRRSPVLAISTDETVPDWVLRRLALSDEVRERHYASMSHHLPLDLFAGLANDENRFVRMGIAGNRSTPELILALLCTDRDDEVLRVVAKNPNTPEENAVLAALSMGSNPVTGRE